MANWYYCDNATKGIVAGGHSSAADAYLKPARDGMSFHVIPDGLVNGRASPPDFDRLKDHYCDRIDSEGGDAFDAATCASAKASIRSAATLPEILSAAGCILDMVIS